MPPDRFFAASILDGRLHVRGIPERGPWDLRRFEYQSEAYVDAGLLAAAGDRKVRTEQELAPAMAAASRRAPFWIIWILNGLEKSACAWRHPVERRRRPGHRHEIR